MANGVEEAVADEIKMWREKKIKCHMIDRGTFMSGERWIGWFLEYSNHTVMTPSDPKCQVSTTYLFPVKKMWIILKIFSIESADVEEKEAVKLHKEWFLKLWEPVMTSLEIHLK